MDVLDHRVGPDSSEGNSSSQLYFMERELEKQIAESMKDSQTLRERFENDLVSVREDVQRRASERNLHTKRQQAKLKEKISSAEREKADALHHSDLLQEQLIVAAGEIRLARDRIFELEAETQSLKARGPRVVERADPASVAETSRLRDREVATAEQARMSQREACEARQEVGRELAVNQGLQRDVDNARHRLLTVQGSLAEAVEENAGIRRALEAERIKAAGGSRRLEEAVERHDAALVEIRKDSAKLREQRDSFGQDCAVLSTTLRRLKRAEGTRRIMQALQGVQRARLGKGLRGWTLWCSEARHFDKQTRKQRQHDAEIASLEADLSHAERRCRETERKVEALRCSRTKVADAVARSSSRLGGIAAAAEERGAGSALLWCFWGWARLTRQGIGATATRARRLAAKEQMRLAASQLADALEKAEGLEKDRDEHRAAMEAFRSDLSRRDSELENGRIALSATQELARVIRNRCFRFGAVRLHHVLKDVEQKRLMRSFRTWNRVARLAYNAVVLSSQDTLRTCFQGTPVDNKAKDMSTTLPALIPTKMATAHDEVNVGKEEIHPCSQCPLQSRSEQAGKKLHVESAVEDIGGSAGLPLQLPDRPPNTENEWLGDPSEAGASCPDSVPLACSLSVHRITTPHANRRDPTLHSPGFDGSPCTSSAGSSASRAEYSVDAEWDATAGSTFDAGRPIEATATHTSRTHVHLDKQSSEDEEGTNISLHRNTPTDLPRLVQALRTSIAHELYAAGERLLRCVEADHGEIHGRPYVPVSLTGAERAQFRACLQDVTQGPIGVGVHALLRAQESSRAVAVEQDRTGKNRGRMSSGCGSGGTRRGKEMIIQKQNPVSVDESAPSAAPVFKTGALSSTVDKASAARYLRDRLIVLLEITGEVWAVRRRPWQDLCRLFRNASGGRRRLESAKQQLRPAATALLKESYTGIYCLDSGSGPRKFWEAVCGPRFVDATWNVDLTVLEEQLWGLALLVRNQDRGQGMALTRHSRLRRVLDLRVYEIILLHVRTRLIWDGMNFGVNAENRRQSDRGEDTSRLSTTAVVDNRYIGPLSIAVEQAILSFTGHDNGSKR